MLELAGHSEQEEKPGADSSLPEQSSTEILVIDDDPHFLRVLQRILSGERFGVTATSNSCEAIEFLSSHKFDLIICDLRMPGCDGLTVLQSLRNAGNDVPLIILTAYGEVDTY